MNGEKKNEMYRCAKCPKETATCVKMDFDDRQECIEPYNEE